jgi:hypothetical protein
VGRQRLQPPAWTEEDSSVTQPLDNNAVRKLDALNLVETFTRKDDDARKQILAIRGFLRPPRALPEGDDADVL